MCSLTTHKNGKRYRDDFNKMAVGLYHYGQSVRDLSIECGISRVTIYAWLKKLNLMEMKDGSSFITEACIEFQKEILKLQC